MGQGVRGTPLVVCVCACTPCSVDVRPEALGGASSLPLPVILLIIALLDGKGTPSLFSQSSASAFIIVELILFIVLEFIVSSCYLFIMFIHVTKSSHHFSV